MPTKRSAVQPSLNVARRLRALLDFHAMRPVELARRVGVTPPSVSQWLSATVAISAKNAKKIADLFGEDVEFVIGRTDRGTRGLGALMGAIEEHLGGERLRQLEGAIEKNPHAFRAMVDDFLADDGRKSDGETQP